MGTSQLLLAAASSGGSSTTTILVTLIASGAITGAIVTLVKLGSKLSGGTRSEQDVATLAQAQGANEILSKTLEEVTRDRDYWKTRHDTVDAAYKKLLDEVRKYGL